MTPLDDEIPYNSTITDIRLIHRRPYSCETSILEEQQNKIVTGDNTIKLREKHPKILNPNPMHLNIGNRNNINPTVILPQNRLQSLTEENNPLTSSKRVIEGIGLLSRANNNNNLIRKA
jgi:hypothetical protein